MELSDLATRLPPRKRLLAGLKNPNQCIDLELPAQLTSTVTGSRIREILNSPNLSPEEVVISLRSIALSASEAAAAARSVAMEKAAVAARARENARWAIEVLDSLSNGDKRDGKRGRGRPRLKKRPIEDLCRDERLLNGNKLPRNSVRDEKVGVCEKDDFDEGKNGRFRVDRPRAKRKRLFLNEVEEREEKKLKPNNSFVDRRKKMENHHQKNSSKDGSNSNSNSNKLTSVWRCIKFKTLQCGSDEKVLHRNGTKASAFVEAE